MRQLHDGLWVLERPLPLRGVGDLGCRMTVMRSDEGDLVLHSPVSLDAPALAALRELGTVRWIVAPSLVHSMFVGAAHERFPEARVIAAPGLATKRPELTIHHHFHEPPQDWPADIPFVIVWGAPLQNEVVFLHRPSRTVVFTDLVFNITNDNAGSARLFHWLVGSRNRFGPHRLIRAGLRDRKAVAEGIRTVLGWDFDRVVMSHGHVLDTGGNARVREAFAFLGSGIQAAPREGEGA